MVQNTCSNINKRKTYFHMIVDCISDLHGHYPELQGGDLLIVAGDLTENDKYSEALKFAMWLSQQNYKKKVVISGNHDKILQSVPTLYEDVPEIFFTYLCDSGTEFEGFKIWGCPWTKSYEGMNPNYKAFTVDTEEELEEKWAMIPHDTQILVTHSPAFSSYDTYLSNKDGKIHSAGSTSLALKILKLNDIRLHVSGHTHREGGNRGQLKKKILGMPDVVLVNASHVDECFEPVNLPVRIKL